MLLVMYESLREVTSVIMPCLFKLSFLDPTILYTDTQTYMIIFNG